MTAGGVAIESAPAAYATGPTITSFAPMHGPVGSTVAISGSGFTGATNVLFGTVGAASFTVESDSVIDATVPSTATTRSIIVDTPSGNVSSAPKTFKVTPTVSSFSPTSGAAGATVVITGNSFVSITKVTFGTVASPSFTVNSPTQITATVPVGGQSAPIKVYSKYGSGASPTSFEESFDVTNFGAVNTPGTGDNTAAFTAAIAAAQKAGAGSIVFVPSGTYDFATGSPASIQIDGSVPIVLAGAGRDTTILVEMTRRKDLLSVKADHTVVQDLTFNTQTNDGGHGIGVGANDTLVQRVAVYSGTLTFGIYYPGPPKAHPGNGLHSEGNVLNDIILNDQLQGDGFSFSFQDDASISNVVHTGSHITIYADTNTTITNYDYTPGNFGGTSGWVISSPCDNVTITNFTTSGFGGQIREAGVVSRVNQNITINNEQMTATAPAGAKPNALFIGDVTGLLIENSSLKAITIQPRYIAQGTVTNTTDTSVTTHLGAGAQDEITFS
jgi:hypothetical protein